MSEKLTKTETSGTENGLNEVKKNWDIHIKDTSSM